MLNSKCRTHGSDHPDFLCPDPHAEALERLQQRFNEVWIQHQQMLFALESTRDLIHRAYCLAAGSFPSKCWKECEEAEDALREAGWMPERR
jgi:hypothetical protein